MNTRAHPKIHEPTLDYAPFRTAFAVAVVVWAGIIGVLLGLS